MNRMVKIVSTLGPSTSSYEAIEKLYLAGVNVFRLNFSHGSQDFHLECIKFIREIENKHNKPVSIIGDLQGPKIRIGKFKDNSATLQAGVEFTLDSHYEVLGDSSRVGISFPILFKSLKVGERVLVDDGKCELIIKSVTANSAVVEPVINYTLTNNKGVNYPGNKLDIPAITPKDSEDIKCMLRSDIDYIAISFVQSSKDIYNLRQMVGYNSKIIAKIEKPSAIEDFDMILELSDGIMIARGDLGIEINSEKVPVIQKQIIAKCRSRAKPVIVATQMLDSMIHNTIPTRAESSDVANAVYDGADALMLSGETAVGDHPDLVVNVMNKIITEVEGDENYWAGLDNSYPEFSHISIGLATSSIASDMAEMLNARCLVSYTYGGVTSRRIARERQKYNVAITNNKRLYHQLSLVWGTFPILSNSAAVDGSVIDFVNKDMLSQNLVEHGDIVVVVGGLPFGVGKTNNITVVSVE